MTKAEEVGGNTTVEVHPLFMDTMPIQKVPTFKITRMVLIRVVVMVTTSQVLFCPKEDWYKSKQPKTIGER